MPRMYYEFSCESENGGVGSFDGIGSFLLAKYEMAFGASSSFACGSVFLLGKNLC